MSGHSGHDRSRHCMREQSRKEPMNIFLPDLSNPGNAEKHSLGFYCLAISTRNTHTVLATNYYIYKERTSRLVHIEIECHRIPDRTRHCNVSHDNNTTRSTVCTQDRTLAIASCRFSYIARPSSSCGNSVGGNSHRCTDTRTPTTRYIAANANRGMQFDWAR